VNANDAQSEQVLAAIDLLAPGFEASGLDELEVEAGDLVVRLVRPRAAAPPSPAPATPGSVAAHDAAGGPLTPYGEPAPGMRFVTAPLTGVWYASPSPGARPYVQEGDEIGAGAVVGLIEAMKLFNEIKSDVAGKVVRVLVERGTLVKRQQPLVEIDPR
jgi:acetyl-CoA carboxylase biotin carboxyl carrier protein